MAKVASTCANHTAGSAGQKGGILILTAVAAIPRVGQLVGQQVGLLVGQLVGLLAGP